MPIPDPPRPPCWSSLHRLPRRGQRRRRMRGAFGRIASRRAVVIGHPQSSPGRVQWHLGRIDSLQKYICTSSERVRQVGMDRVLRITHENLGDSQEIARARLKDSERDGEKRETGGSQHREQQKKEARKLT